MAAYLTDHPPVRDQWYAKRNRPLTGCTVLHTAESVMDSIGPDTGAEAVAEFIRTRTTPGSYHDLVDSDSWIPLVDLRHGAYHDGTGSNNWALSISFACRTSDWRIMSPEKRRGFLRQGARAFANQQAYRRSIGAPLTELRLITKAQSDRGESGFTYHGWRDPGRRTDPGVAAPDLFPIDEFLAECRAALTGTPAPAPAPAPEDDMPYSPTELENLSYRAMTNALIDLASGANPASDDIVGYLRAALTPQFAQMQGRVDGLSEALRQVAAAPGQAIDLAAVQAAAKAGTAEAIKAIDVTVRAT